MYKGKELVPNTMDYKLEKPYYFEGITWDEYFVEMYYHGLYISCVASKLLEYKTIRKQLEDGDIVAIPYEYKTLCPFPESCTAYQSLIAE